MTDAAKALVERMGLTLGEWLVDEAPNDWWEYQRDHMKARDLIETQARKIERLRGALEQIAQADYGYTDIIESGAPPEKHADYFCSMVTWRQRTARAALAGDTHD